MYFIKDMEYILYAIIYLFNHKNMGDIERGKFVTLQAADRRLEHLSSLTPSFKLSFSVPYSCPTFCFPHIHLRSSQPTPPLRLFIQTLLPGPLFIPHLLLPSYPLAIITTPLQPPPQPIIGHALPLLRLRSCKPTSSTSSTNQTLMLTYEKIVGK